MSNSTRFNGRPPSAPAPTLQIQIDIKRLVLDGLLVGVLRRVLAEPLELDAELGAVARKVGDALTVDFAAMRRDPRLTGAVIDGTLARAERDFRAALDATIASVRVAVAGPRIVLGAGIASPSTSSLPHPA
jgi:hypothetical protein